MLEKNGYKFNGSKIDRQFSYSKIDFQLKQNEKIQTQDFQTHREDKHSQNQYSVLENVSSALGNLFDFQPTGTDYDPDEAELLKQHKFKKKKKRGFRI